MGIAENPMYGDTDMEMTSLREQERWTLTAEDLLRQEAGLELEEDDEVGVEEDELEDVDTTGLRESYEASHHGAVALPQKGGFSALPTGDVVTAETVVPVGGQDARHRRSGFWRRPTVVAGRWRLPSCWRVKSQDAKPRRCASCWLCRAGG